MFMIEPRKLDSVLRTKGGSLSPPPGGLPLAHRASKQRIRSSEGARRAESRPVPTGRPSEVAAAEIALRPTGESRPTGRAEKVFRESPYARRAALRPSGGLRALRPSGGEPPDRATTTQGAVRARPSLFFSGFSLCF